MKPHVIIQPEREIARGLRAEARCNKFDGKWNAVNLLADPCEWSCARVVECAGSRSASPLDQQLHGR